MIVSCSICSEIFNPTDDIYTTSCGHIFHKRCLLQWLVVSRTCPQCRKVCTQSNIFRIYFNNVSVNLDTTRDTANLLETIDALNLKIQQMEKATNEAARAEKKLRIKIQDVEERHQAQRTTIIRQQIFMSDQQQKLSKLEELKRQNRQLKVDNHKLKSQLNLQDIKASLTLGTLKMEVNDNKFRMNEMKRQLRSVVRELFNEREKRQTYQDKATVFDSEIHILEGQLRKLNTRNTSEGQAADSGEADLPLVEDNQNIAEKQEPINEIPPRKSSSATEIDCLDSTLYHDLTDGSDESHYRGLSDRSVSEDDEEATSVTVLKFSPSSHSVGRASNP